MEKRISLSKIDEASVIWFSPAISLATWYEGEPPIKFLRARIKEIILQNPWLTGRLKRNAKGTYVKYSDSIGDIDILEVSMDENLVSCDGHKYSQMSICALKYCAESGDNSCNKNVPLFRVSLVISAVETKFVFIVSLCHSLGDARSLYQIVKMINEASVVHPLNPCRNENVLLQAISACGEAHMNFLINSSSLFFGSILHLLFDNKNAAAVFKIDSSRIAETKANGKDDSQNQFISTNDILTSWLGRKFDSQFYVMSINMLNRYAQQTTSTEEGRNAHASLFGNYTFQLLLQRGEYEKPQNIRTAVSKVAFSRTHSEERLSVKLPSLWDCINLKGYLVLTNWTGVYEELSFANCKQLIQVPVYPIYLLMHIAVLFRMNPQGDIGMLTVTYPKILKGFEDQCTTSSTNSQQETYVAERML